jgi:hypothetical protein
MPLSMLHALVHAACPRLRCMTWTFRMDMDLQHGHALWTWAYSMDMNKQHLMENAAWSSWTCSMDIVVDMQH